MSGDGAPRLKRAKSWFWAVPRPVSLLRRAWPQPFGYLWDDILAYETEKRVEIRDLNLGFLYFLGVSMVVGYFAVIPMWRDNQYLRLHPVDGRVDVKVHEPVKHGIGNFDKATLPYCSAYNGTKKVFAQYPCRNYLVKDIMQGSGASSMFLMTFESASTFAVDCIQETTVGIEDKQCRRSEEDNFVTDLENYSIGFVHVVRYGAEKPKSILRGKDRPRFIEQRDGTLQEYPESKAEKGRDWFQVKDILDVVGYGLDDQDEDGETYRENGLFITLDIEYVRDRSGGLDKSIYKFSPLPLEARFYHESYQNDSYAEFTKRKGIRIDIHVTGEYGELSFQEFMIAWVSSFALVGFVKVFMNFVMEHLSPRHYIYDAYSKEVTVHFDDFAGGGGLQVDGINSVLKKNAIHAGETTYRQYKHHALAPDGGESTATKSYKNRDSWEEVTNHHDVKEQWAHSDSVNVGTQDSCSNDRLGNLENKFGKLESRFDNLEELHRQSLLIAERTSHSLAALLAIAPTQLPAVSQSPEQPANVSGRDVSPDEVFAGNTGV